jgi:hypothetical protein
MYYILYIIYGDVDIGIHDLPMQRPVGVQAIEKARLASGWCYQHPVC